MSLDYIKPIDADLINFIKELPPQSIGNTIEVYTEINEFPDLEGLRVAIIGLNEYRNATAPVYKFNINDFRKSFYQLYPGNWKLKIADLGNLPCGRAVSDSYILIKDVAKELKKKNIIPVFIGGSQDITYPLYCSYENSNEFINLTSIDCKFDFSKGKDVVSKNTYINKIIKKKPNYLNIFTNIGYQSYYVSIKELDLVERLFFNCYRLGEVLDDVSITEPIFRDSNLVSIDIKSLSATTIGNFDGLSSPNGFDGRTICNLARYAGISDKVSCLGIFELYPSFLFQQLLSQIVWYFIEGVEFRFDEYPVIIKNCLRYIVSVNNNEFVFFKSKNTNRWWIEIKKDTKNNNSKKNSLLSCSYNEYINACNNKKLPNRFWKAIQIS